MNTLRIKLGFSHTIGRALGVDQWVLRYVLNGGGGYANLLRFFFKVLIFLKILLFATAYLSI